MNDPEATWSGCLPLACLTVALAAACVSNTVTSVASVTEGGAPCRPHCGW